MQDNTPHHTDSKQTMPPMGHGSMVFAIVDANRLSCMGLQYLLQDLVPGLEVEIFTSFEELVVSEPERFVHYFVSSGIYFEHAAFFLKQVHRSIVMVQGENFPHTPGLFTLNVSQNEAQLTRSLIRLQHRGHGGDGKPTHPAIPSVLSQRETEVAILLAKGLINKEIADRLCISLTTVISHRKNIMDKLKARSLADIIVYVVSHGMINVEEL